jgi:hypothetical protein
MQNVNTNPAVRHKTRTFTNSLVRYFMLSCASFFCGGCDTPFFLRLSTSHRSLDRSSSTTRRLKRAARAGRGVGLSDSRCIVVSNFC